METFPFLYIIQGLVLVERHPTPNVFNKGDSLEVYGWGNLDLEQGSFAEHDIAIDYTFPIVDEAKFLGGNLTGYVELAHWEFTDGRLGENVKGLIGKITYDGPISASLKATQFLNAGGGQELDFTLSKAFDLGKTEGVMPPHEQSPGEHYRLNQRLKF